MDEVKYAGISYGGVTRLDSELITPGSALNALAYLYLTQVHWVRCTCVQ